MDLQDKVIVCVECKKEFTHTVEDQKRNAERGFHQEPKRCADCRRARSERNAHRKANPPPSQEVGAASDFGVAPRDSRGGYGGGYGGGRGERRGGGGGRGGGGPSRFQDRGPPPGGSGGGGFGGPRPSFQAVCAACGVNTTVPFEPTPGRQVYCRDCFKKRGG